MGDPSEVDKHLAEGKRLLQEGQLSDALYHYAAAVGECTEQVHTPHFFTN